MYSITCVFSILSLIILTNSASFENKPIIIVTQGVIEKNGFLPIFIFWYHPNFTDEDYLVYYSLYPRKLQINSIPIDSYTGFYELPLEDLEHGENSDKYCAEIWRINGSQFLSPSCTSKVQWMYDRKELLGNVPMMDLIYPGTHQSAAYANSNDESLSDQSLISRWILCQSRSIKTQLMEGIRYLDLRPGFLFIEGKKKYITTHNMFDLISMDEAVKQINEFMEISNDVVIVSFREFSKGFNSHDDHLHFMSYLAESFKKHAHPRSFWNDPMKKMWTSDKRLILTYEYEFFHVSPIIWVPINQYWANAQTINRLHSYFDEIHRDVNRFNSFFAASIQLTHSPRTIIQDAFGGEMSLRHWAERLGRLIPQWYIEAWSEAASIVVADFYQTSGIVDLVIQLNERRFDKLHSNHTA